MTKLIVEATQARVTEANLETGEIKLYGRVNNANPVFLTVHLNQPQGLEKVQALLGAMGKIRISVSVEIDD